MPRSRSVRTALRDVSNRNDGGGRISKSASAAAVKKKDKEPLKLEVKLEAEAEAGEEKDRNDGALDRLLLVQSDISALIHQIDELVVQAFQCKGSQSKEVEAFTKFLSEMISSLKPWVPRFQKALSAAPAESAENEVGSAGIDSPRESLISPSPLVSWRADCTIERGRHLFKLTPLPISKSLCSKPPMASRSSAFDRITYSNADGTPLFHASYGDGNGGLLDLVATKPTPSRPCRSSIATEAANNLELGFASTPMFSKQGSSMVVNVRTPGLKMSPPKSCVVLEPISESSPKGHHKIHKSTPYPVGFKNCSESSDSEATEDLAFRFPELLALQQAYKPGIRKKHVETSPEWNMSPPKTCVLLQPPDEKPSKNAARFPITTSVPVKEMSFSVSKENDGGGISLNKTSWLQEPVGGSFALIENTPIWKEAQSIVRTGKHPGENTLKRELWTKFEAATADSVEFKDSVTHRGFLDRLDEEAISGESEAHEFWSSMFKSKHCFRCNVLPGFPNKLQKLLKTIICREKNSKEISDSLIQDPFDN